MSLKVSRSVLKRVLVGDYQFDSNIDLKATPLTFEKAVEKELQKHGEPLRWAITEVNTEKQTAQIEAIVTQGKPI